ncbi:rCG25479 [Rattus norvegicus]|uniref:RCG25479 n=1 Tax=Rattus norvegicus TaxID=10116 RepID=A6I3L3_RAT|nr:rCG25479 [Rattus norvegicus]
MDSIKQSFSTFLMISPFNTIPHVVVTPRHKLFSLLLQSCNFVTLFSCDVNIFGDRGLRKEA